MRKIRILLAEDDQRYARRLQRNLEDERFEVEMVPDGQAAFERLQKESFNLLLADIKMPGKDGLELLKDIKGGQAAGIDPDFPVILLTSVDSVKTAVEAMRSGAEDYLTKDADWEEIVVHLNRALEHHRRIRENERLRSQVEARDDFGEVIALSPAMGEVLRQVEEIAPTEATVLITGETGVGKELVARQIHKRSQRGGGPFLEVNCAALPDDNMFQSELFGHEKGSFTGAHEMRKGRFELAQGGTLFLDEIGDLSIDSQAKILRAIETLSFERLGGARKIQADVRLVLATNHDLQKNVEQGTFRRDLYYRIHVFHIPVPPLRDRKEDIATLARYFLDDFREKYRRTSLEFSGDAQSLLENYSWPGNVRELRNLMERLALVKADGTVTQEDLSACGLNRHVEALSETQMPQDGSLEEIEQAAILRALEKADWIQKDAAAILDISVDRMNARIKKYGITHPKWKTHR